MFDPKRYILVGGTVVAALGIGFVMQQFPEPGPRVAQGRTDMQTAALDASPDAPAAVQSDVMPDLGVFGLSGVAHTSASPEPAEKPAKARPESAPEETEVAAVEPEGGENAVVSDAQPLAQADSCEPMMTAESAPAAMVELSISAVCLPSARLTIHHNGMMLSYRTDDAGNATIRVPALASEALFIASFENGEGAVARALVADIADYERVILQWRGEAGFQLHAFEFGAGYGEDGHIWQQSPGVPARALDGQGGFVAALGDPAIDNGLRGEVYTFPISAAAAGKVELSAEIAVSDMNCARDIEAQALQLVGSGDLKAQDLALAMPSCEVAGDILMLKNLLQDMKIAQN